MSALNFNKFLLCTVNVLFAFAGIILNSIVIISFLKSQLRRKICYFMILILACFDLAVATVLHLVVVLESLDPSKKIYIIGGQLLILSLAAVLTMTVERYVAMVYPFLLYKYWDLFIKMALRNNRTEFCHSQSATRTMKFH
jgi:hypothetical protein